MSGFRFIFYFIVFMIEYIKIDLKKINNGKEKEKKDKNY